MTENILQAENKKPVFARQWLNRLLRLAVSVSLLFWLLKGIDWRQFRSLLSQASPVYMSLALAFVLIAVIISAYKWQRLLAAQAVAVPLRRLFVFYLVGLFFNNFLPTNIGGDVVRMHDAAKYSGKTAEAVTSVVAERLLAALALALTALVGLLLSYQTTQRFGGLVIGVLTVTLGITLLFAVDKWHQALSRVISLPEKFDIRRRLQSFGSTMGKCLQNRSNVVYVVFLSVLFQLTVVAVTWFIFLALRLDVPFVYCLLVIPIISAIQMLPVSISGFGVREGAYVFFFAGFGISSTGAIASSLIFWMLVALVSLSGGAIFALRK